MKNRVVVILMMLIMILPSIVFADEYNGLQTNVIIGQTGQGAERSSLFITRELLGTFQVIGSIVSVVALIIIGLRYMMSSVQDRADMKGTLIYYIIGAVLVFSTSNVLGIAYDVIAGLDGHTWDEGVVTIEPTCKQKGEKTYTCATCQIQRKEVLEKNSENHEWQFVKEIQSTCKEFGDKLYECACGEEKTEYDVIELDYENGHYYIYDEDYTDCSYTAATCTANSVRVEVCKRCLNTEPNGTRTIIGNDMKSHDYSVEVSDEYKAPTCTSGGSKTLKCSGCTDETTLELAALGHNEETKLEAVAATCIAKGKTEGKACSRCGEIMVAQVEIDPLGHEMVEDIEVPATCTTDGRSAGSHCSRTGCIHTTGGGVINALEHNYEITSTTATCTSNGTTTYEFSRCFDTKTETGTEFNSNKHDDVNKIYLKIEGVVLQKNSYHIQIEICYSCGEEISREKIKCDFPKSGNVECDVCKIKRNDDKHSKYITIKKCCEGSYCYVKVWAKSSLRDYNYAYYRSSK